MVQNWIFKRYGMTLTLYLEILIKVTAHPLPTSPVYVKYHSKNRGKGRKYTLWTKILKTWCDMTLTLVLENLFKVKVQLGTLWVKYKPDWTKGIPREENI